MIESRLKCSRRSWHLFAPCQLFALCGLFSLASMLGCDQGTPFPSTAGLRVMQELNVPENQKILAQGRLEPAGGVIPLAAPPGDRIDRILVEEGQKVKSGDVLVVLASLEVRQAEINAAEAKLDEARNQLEISRQTAAARLKAAQIGLRSAQLKELQAGMGDRQLAQADMEIQEAQRVLGELQSASQDPDVASLVGLSKLNRQQLEVQKAVLERDRQTAELDAAKETARLAVEAAEQEVEAATNAMKLADDGSVLKVLQEQIEVLKLQRKASELKSPIDGTVISLDASVGQPTGATPILQLADDSKMICEVEVDVAELSRLKPGNAVTIDSPAFAQVLRGKIEDIPQLMGTPRLPQINPMARSDWRSALVTITVDEAHLAEAAKRIHLQVDVALEGAPRESESSKQEVVSKGAGSK